MNKKADPFYLLAIPTWIIQHILLLTVCYLCYKYLTMNFNYWEKRGIFYFKPIPFFGNFYRIMTFQTTIAEGMKEFYDKTEEPYFGIFSINKPVLVIKSPELVKRILVTDFSYFSKRTWATAKHNNVISRFMVLQNYTDWKIIRPTLSSGFSNTKLKVMSTKIIEVATLANTYITQHLGVINCRKFGKLISTEITTRTFFGIDGGCFEKESSYFKKLSQRVCGMSLRNGICQGTYIFKPELADLFRLNFLKYSDQECIINAIKSSLAQREKATINGKRTVTDYIDIMLQIKENNGVNSAEYQGALANTVLYFIAGVETSGSLIAHTLYEWAINPWTQDKARAEVTGLLNKYGEISFENLQELEYLTLCINETARKYVTLQVLDRQAVKDYKSPDGDLFIEKGTNIFIPYYAMHMDEKYFKEPQKYIPERYLDPNINSKGLYYMPFGAGPRTCIGEKFAIVAAKLVLSSILASFKVEKCDSTPYPVKFEPKSFTLQSDVGLPLNFKLLES